jgi:hypothetical protein
VKKKYIIRGFFVPTLISNETFCLHWPSKPAMTRKSLGNEAASALSVVVIVMANTDCWGFQSRGKCYWSGWWLQTVKSFNSYKHDTMES